MIPFERPPTYRNFKGESNVDSSYRIQPGEDGVFLKDSRNMIVDKTGSIETRLGSEQIWSLPTDNLYTDGKIIVGTISNNLCIIYPNQNWRSEVILSKIGLGKWSYTNIGDKIFGSEESIIGYIQNNTWNTFPVVTQKYKRRFPACRLLTKYKGRLYGAIDNNIIYSDAMSYMTIDERSDKSYISRGSRVSMIQSVDDGIWVADQSNIMFMRGSSPEEFLLDFITDYGIIEGSDASVGLSYINKELWPMAVICATPKGICALGNSGKIVNMTELQYDMPSAIRALGFISRGRINQYTVILK